MRHFLVCLALWQCLHSHVAQDVPKRDDPTSQVGEDGAAVPRRPIQTTTMTPISVMLNQFNTAWNEFWGKNLGSFKPPPGRGGRPGLPSDTTTTAYQNYGASGDALHAVLRTERRGRVAVVTTDEREWYGALEIFQDDDTLLCHDEHVREQYLLPTSPWDHDDDGDDDNDCDDDTSDPHIGMVLEVYNLAQGRICSVVENRHDQVSIEVTYQLDEALHMELGSTYKHAADFAYVPVITAGTEPIRITGDAFHDAHRNQDNAESIEGRPNLLEWWQWWIPWWKWDGSQDHSQQYRMHSSFAGGSHGEVWRGRRRCSGQMRRWKHKCQESLIFKRLKIENGYRVLEAGLREIYFGSLLAAEQANLFTDYVDHFFRERQDMEPELWIVFRDAGPSLRSFIYTGTLVGDFVIYQHSPLWTQLRTSVSQNRQANSFDRDEDDRYHDPPMGRNIFRRVLRQIVESAAFLHQRGIVHRDIKPPNIMCHSNLDPNDTLSPLDPSVRCVLGDFSSAWNKFTDENLYTGGPSRAEQTDEYAPPESFYDDESPWLLSPVFDSWSIGIVALELLLGTPNVFMVDQRTKAVLTHKLERQGASEKEIERALYLAALSQFCIYNPQHVNHFDWPLRMGDPLHKSAMVKETCNLHDFHRALRARDPLGLGFDSSSDQLLLLIWRLLAWNPSERITPREALQHPYFFEADNGESQIKEGSNNRSLESLMLDPRRDFNLTDTVTEFTCPRCGRVFGDWESCRKHAHSRKHAKFCRYDHSSLPTCLNAHSMLPAHVGSGHCDIQGRRRTIEDMHAVELTSTEHFYGIFDGHSGNRASKYTASFLFAAMKERLALFLSQDPDTVNAAWSETITSQVQNAFHDLHNRFLDAIALISQSRNDQSGTTATVAFITKDYVVLASLGDSRAVLSTKKEGKLGAMQLTKDHVASDPVEKAEVERRGGKVIKVNNLDRVNGTLAVTRSLGDSRLSELLSQTPDVMPFTREVVLEMCGELKEDNRLPCFLILASDGLWDAIDNNEAVDLVVDTIEKQIDNESQISTHTVLQRASEALVHEAYVRGSSDNIGVCVISLSQFEGDDE